MALATTSLFTKKTAFAALVVASVLLLSTGCAPESLIGGGIGGSGSSTGADGSKSSDGTSGKDGKDNKDDKGGTSKKGDTASGTLTGKDCMPGTWLFDNEGFRKFLADLAGTFNIATSGNVTLTLRADGSAETFYDHWTHDVSVEAGKAVVERHGKDQGVYSVAANGTMSMSDTSIGSITTVVVTASGQQIVQSVDPEPSVFSQAAVTCKGDTLEINVDGFTVLMHRKG